MTVFHDTTSSFSPLVEVIDVRDMSISREPRIMVEKTTLSATEVRK